MYNVLTIVYDNSSYTLYKDSKRYGRPIGVQQNRRLKDCHENIFIYKNILVTVLQFPIL